MVVAGLGWGDCSKGATVDHLCRKYNAALTVRYNGGSQCGHSVVLADGRQHTFAQFGSGTLAGVPTHLSRFMLVNPLNMMLEEEHLRSIGIEDAFDRLSVDPNALVTTPFDVAMNRIKENSRGINAHGSCGMGIGETRAYSIKYGDEALTVGDFSDLHRLKLKLRLRQLRAIDEATALSSSIDYMSTDDYMLTIAARYLSWNNLIGIRHDMGILRSDILKGAIIFEGAQGILLDERDDFMPHNTYTDTTFRNADQLIKWAGYDMESNVTRIGCIRSYATRHGAGPFTTEDKKLDFLAEPHNASDGFQGAFRRGHFNMKAVNQALDIAGGVDEIHVSHMDQLDSIYPGIDHEKYVSNIEKLTETPITCLGYGPTAEDRRERGSSVVSKRRSLGIKSGLPLCAAGD